MRPKPPDVNHNVKFKVKDGHTPRSLENPEPVVRLMVSCFGSVPGFREKGGGWELPYT